MNELETFLAGLAKDALVEVGSVEREILGQAVRAAFRGNASEASRLIALVSESIGAKLAADKLRG